jgi:hypothetical protein
VWHTIAQTERVRDSHHPSFTTPLLLPVLREGLQLKLTVHDAPSEGPIGLVHGKSLLAGVSFGYHTLQGAQAVLLGLCNRTGAKIPDCSVSLLVSPMTKKSAVQLAVNCRGLPVCDAVVVLFAREAGERELFFAKTECVRANSNPVFQANFCMESPSLPGNSDVELVFRVYNAASGVLTREGLMGQSSVTLSALLAGVERGETESDFMLGAQATL